MSSYICNLLLCVGCVTFGLVISRVNGINTTFHSLRDANCSEFTNINDCDGTEKDGYMCYWNSESSQCDVLVCTLLNTLEECAIYSAKDYNYLCAWQNNFSVPVGNGIEFTAPYCYNNCTEKFEYVVTVDTSSSVESETAQQFAIKYAFYLVWDLVTIKAKKTGIPTHEILKLAFVTFARDVRVHFDLHNNFTTIDEYIDAIDQVFAMEDLYQSDTNTATALNVSARLFRESRNHLQSDWRHVQLFTTDGTPTIPSLSVSPCDEDHWHLIEQYTESEITFAGFFITVDGVEISDTNNNGIPDLLDCFAEAPLYGQFDALDNYLEATVDLTSIVCYHDDDDESADFPSSIPTEAIEPSSRPTEIMKFWWNSDSDFSIGSSSSSSDSSSSSSSSSSSDDEEVEVEIHLTIKK